jgi:hypothetical protein
MIAPLLPHYPARDEPEREAIRVWVYAKLDELDEIIEANLNLPRGDDVDFLNWLLGDGPIIAEARKGNLQPLRDKYPHLAEFLQPPKIGRGKYRRVRKPDQPSKLELDAAVYDYHRINELFRKLLGVERRRKEDGPSSIELAAARWGIDPERLAAIVLHP